GIIMGLPTCIWMLVGALVGWGVLSPIAKTEGWAPGPVGDWKNGSRGWILWVSLAVMIAESVVSLSLITWKECKRWAQHFQQAMGRRRERRRLLDGTVGGDEQPNGSRSPRNSYGVAGEGSQQTTPEQNDQPQTFKPMAVMSADSPQPGDDGDDEDVDPRYLVPGWVIWGGLLASTLLCMGIVKAIFNIPMYDTLIAVLLALPLAVLGVRALGETDLNPVSGIGKVSQVIFAGVMPGNIIGNLVAGGIAEAGAQQAGDLMQDLKTGHLLHASPRAQFVAQMIGSVFSVFVSAGAYKLYNRVYEIPGPQFPVPTGQVWLDMARLVNGRPLPPHVWPFIAVFSAIFVVLPILLLLITKSGKRSWQIGRFTVSTLTVERWWPSGIAFAIGIYNTPNFTLMRAIGAIAAATVTEFLVARNRRSHALSAAEEQLYRRKIGMLVIILASGFVLGEGTFSFGILLFEAFL
ncbi:OPT super, partial [Linderina pennispora]